MSELTASVTKFGAGNAIEDSAETPIDDATYDGPIEPGWTLELGDLGLSEPPSDGFVTLTVGTAEIDVDGDGVLTETEFSLDERMTTTQAATQAATQSNTREDDRLADRRAGGTVRSAGAAVRVRAVAAPAPLLRR